MRDPIVILGMPRSGTSMTAGILALHGVWTGECRGPHPLNPRGFFENQAVKSWLMQASGHDLRKEHHPDADDFRDAMLGILDAEGYEGGPWLVKHSAAYWRAWDRFDPLFVCVRRPMRANVRAMDAMGIHKELYTRRELIQAWSDHHAIMDRLRDERGGVDVHTADVAGGDFSSIRAAVEAAGLAFDQDAVSEFVEPEYWHHR